MILAVINCIVTINSFALSSGGHNMVLTNPMSFETKTIEECLKKTQAYMPRLGVKVEKEQYDENDRYVSDIETKFEDEEHRWVIEVRNK